MKKPMLARDYDKRDPAGFGLGEKYDGVRARWTGERFESRNGKGFAAPAEWVVAMPAGVVVEGELWFKRERFQKTVSMVKCGDFSELSFMVFDVVGDGGYADRLAGLAEMVLPDFCQVVEWELCESARHLREYERELVNGGAEGVILRDPAAEYVAGRSWGFMKWKRLSAAEGVVVDHSFKKGASVYSALVVEWSGKVFKLSSGLSARELESKPAVGAVVTFSYYGLTDAGLPRHAGFECVRDYE